MPTAEIRPAILCARRARSGQWAADDGGRLSQIRDRRAAFGQGLHPTETVDLAVVVDHRAMIAPYRAMVTTTLLVDGMLSGTGIRDTVEGGYIAPGQLNLSADLCSALAAWVSEYAQVHFSGYDDETAISALDREGLVLRDRLAEERPDHIVGYYSNALLKRLDDLPRA